MTLEEGNRASTLLGRLSNIRTGVLAVVGFAAIVTLMSVGIAAAVDASVGGDKASRFGQIGQMFESAAAVFSGLAFVALVVTFLLQLEELKLQRRELGSQKDELHRTAEGLIRLLHVQLVKMAIDDPELNIVWPPLPIPEGPLARKHYQYANLIIQHQWLMLSTGTYREEDVRQLLRQLFTSPFLREYWAALEEVRAMGIAPDSAEWAFTRLVNEVFNEQVGQPTEEPGDD